MKSFIVNLEKIAIQKAWADTLDGNTRIVDDYAGGNVDDAYAGGYRDGEIIQARDILEIFKKYYSKYIEECEKIGKPFHDLGDFVEERLAQKEEA